MSQTKGTPFDSGTYGNSTPEMVIIIITTRWLVYFTMWNIMPPPSGQRLSSQLSSTLIFGWEMCWIYVILINQKSISINLNPSIKISQTNKQTNQLLNLKSTKFQSNSNHFSTLIFQLQIFGWTVVEKLILVDHCLHFFFLFFFYLCRTYIMALTAVHKSTRVHNQM